MLVAAKGAGTGHLGDDANVVAVKFTAP